MVAFVTVLLCSNLIGPSKLGQLWGIKFAAGVLFFPFSYIFGDVLTEVYGYAHARKVIWAGFGAQLFATLMSMAVLAFPPAPEWPHQAALETAFGAAPRIMAASVLAYWAGEFVNSYIMAKMKVLTQGRMLWTRTIGSTIFGQLVDSAIFYPIAFWGIWSGHQLITVLITGCAVKTAWEAAMTPFTYKLVAFLKKHEGVDVYDTNTDFNPFHIGT
ncbi:MAG: queuosine precursor transporter [Bdellovibrionota bacterium]